MYHTRRRKLLSQNFLKSSKLVNHLVSKSSIDSADLVIEIGPGKGIITNSLIQQAKQVEAIEVDYNWVKHLNSKFKQSQNLSLIQADFLKYTLPTTDYKVFANVPFSIEGKIVRKLIDAPNPPEDTYLIVNRELAYRLSAYKSKDNLFSLCHKPWFDFSIPHVFSPYDFEPVPNVIPALFRFVRKKHPLLAWSERNNYQEFLTLGFGQGQSILKNLSKKYLKTQLQTQFQRLSINKKTKPTDLDLFQWIKLYQQLKNF